MKRLGTTTINGKRWQIVSETIDGLCDDPHAPASPQSPRYISIGAHLAGRRLLEVTLHETTHAVLPELSEEQVAALAKHQARVAWQLGWRKAQP